jgi:uncharacterized membrane protein YsdA (DUF1294 family)
MRPYVLYAILATYAVLSVIAFALYGLDKRAAVRGARRTPERTLHLISLAGGWPGALVAQSAFRHKRRKGRFMAVFAATVLIHAAAWGMWARYG